MIQHYFIMYFCLFPYQSYTEIVICLNIPTKILILSPLLLLIFFQRGSQGIKVSFIKAQIYFYLRGCLKCFHSNYSTYQKLVQGMETARVLAIKFLLYMSPASSLFESSISLQFSRDIWFLF